MKISELAQATGTPADTIRYYEREGLLPEPARGGNNYRVYGAEHAERLAFIRQARGLDMSLDEIRVLLRWQAQPGADCGAVNALVDEHIQHIATRIRELRALERQLKALRASCAAVQPSGDCGILVGLSSALERPVDAPLRSARHLGAVHGQGGG